MRHLYWLINALSQQKLGVVGDSIVLERYGRRVVRPAREQFALLWRVREPQLIYAMVVLGAAVVAVAGMQLLK